MPSCQWRRRGRQQQQQRREQRERQQQPAGPHDRGRGQADPGVGGGHDAGPAACAPHQALCTRERCVRPSCACTTRCAGVRWLLAYWVAQACARSVCHTRRCCCCCCCCCYCCYCSCCTYAQPNPQLLHVTCLPPWWLDAWGNGACAPEPTPSHPTSHRQQPQGRRGRRGRRCCRAQHVTVLPGPGHRAAPQRLPVLPRSRARACSSSSRRGCSGGRSSSSPPPGRPPQPLSSAVPAQRRQQQWGCGAAGAGAGGQLPRCMAGAARLVGTAAR